MKVRSVCILSVIGYVQSSDDKLKVFIRLKCYCNKIYNHVQREAAHNRFSASHQGQHRQLISNVWTLSPSSTMLRVVRDDLGDQDPLWV